MVVARERKGEDVEKRTRSLTHLSLPQSTVQDKSLDVMLLLTNGIARNSALSYEHVRDSFLSLSPSHSLPSSSWRRS